MLWLRNDDEAGVVLEALLDHIEVKDRRRGTIKCPI